MTYRQHGEFVIINRHGAGVPLPPHAINHRANIRALAGLGYPDVVSLNSVGSLKPELPPGTLVSCGDYVGLQQGPATFFDTELKGGAPGFANNPIPLLVRKLAPEFKIRTGRVYVQMRGPRFETRAEIRIIRKWGDVVGMTAAHEADLCAEAGLRTTASPSSTTTPTGSRGCDRFTNSKILLNRIRERLTAFRADDRDPCPGTCRVSPSMFLSKWLPPFRTDLRNRA